MASFEDSVVPLSINGMQGRMLQLKNSKSKKEILLIYGHHSSIERMRGFAEYMNRFGNVTIGDLPGFGGMDSFYSIGMKPTIDNYADYLASLIKVKYKKDTRYSIVSMSFSFLIVTRMLQKYPEMAKQIDDIFSFVGFTHYQDFHMSKKSMWAIKTTARLFGGPVGSRIFRYTFLLSPVIAASYFVGSRKHSKMKDAGGIKELSRRIKAEIKLWHINDVRTRMSTILQMFRVDLCKYNQRIDHQVHHIYVENDRYFDSYMVKQHMSVIYSDYVSSKSPMGAHMPSIVADAHEAMRFMPEDIEEKLEGAKNA